MGEAQRNFPLSGLLSFRTYFQSIVTPAREHLKVNPHRPLGLCELSSMLVSPNGTDSKIIKKR